MIIILSLILLFFCAVFLVRWYRNYAIKKNLLDNPNSRSSHKIPTPRGGGIVFPILWLSFILGMYFFHFLKLHELLFFIPGTVLISIIGFLDDRFNISVKWRFLIQFVVAVLSIIILKGFNVINLGFINVNLGLWGSILALLSLVWSINLYNFMDGIDGLAAIEALFVFGGGGLFIWQAGGNQFAIVIWSLAIIVTGFLFWNWPPAKIFMGDVGSGLLGYLVILFGLIGEIWYHVPIIIWGILYCLFWFDASVTLIRRVLHKETWYKAHRLHAYQRLQLQKWSHTKILFGTIFINFALFLIALLANNFRNYLLWFLLLAITLVSLVYFLIEKKQPMYIDSV